mgnify:CR=1 FL=1
MEKYVMALDQGTTSSRCILFNKKGEMVSCVNKAYRQIYPQPGWVEHDPFDIWESQLEAAQQALKKAGASAENISAIGITNQRETTIVWNRETGKPVYNAIVWQCRRTSGIIDEIPEEVRAIIEKRTGLIPDAYFSATKIKWILDSVPGAREEAEAGKLLFGTVDTWLLWNLTKGRVHATDYTNASRTMLFDIKRLCFDEELLDYFKIPATMMPEVHPSGYEFGESDEVYFGGKIKIGSLIGDQQASLFGLGCFEKGDAKNTYGTGCFLLMNTGKEAIASRNGLITTVAGGLGGDVDYALEGSIYIGGAVVQWLRDEMKIIKTAAESEELALKAGNSGGAYLVPSFTGLGAPYWSQDARGTLVGITRGFNNSQLVRAALESIAFQTHDVIRAMEADAGFTMKSLMTDGGASANNFLMQFQADIVGTEILRADMLENTALGAAYLAGLISGCWESLSQIKENRRSCRKFTPEMKEIERTEILAGWHRAVRTALEWTKE